jgi:hypothetical protein
VSAPAGTTTAEASHYSPSSLIIQAGIRIELADFAWGLREIMVTAAGPIADKMCPCLTFEAEVARHESAHVLVEFMTGARMRGASIIVAPGHSGGRTSNRMPPPDAIPISDQERIDSYMHIGGPHYDLAEIEAFVTTLLTDFAPLVRRLAAVLLERKSMSARACRRVLFKAMKKDLRRAKIVAEKDRRAQAAFALERKQAIGSAHSPLCDARFQLLVWVLAGPLAECAQPFRRSVADHESGHATIAWLLGLDVLSVSMVGRPDVRVGKSCFRVGCTVVACPATDPTSIVSAPLSDREFAARACMAASAMSGRPGWRGAVEVYHRARQEAKRLVTENMPLILTLAQALSQHRELDGEQIATILGPRDGTE